jgi:hypothetical protein
MIVDDYAYYLMQANLESSGPGVALKVARATGIASPLIAGAYLAANVLALGALVVLDPADLRERERKAKDRSTWMDRSTQADAVELFNQVKEIYQYSGPSSGMVKDERGVIDII